MDLWTPIVGPSIYPRKVEKGIVRETKIQDHFISSILSDTLFKKTSFSNFPSYKHLHKENILGNFNFSIHSKENQWSWKKGMQHRCLQISEKNIGFILRENNWRPQIIHECSKIIWKSLPSENLTAPDVQQTFQKEKRRLTQQWKGITVLFYSNLFRRILPGYLGKLQSIIKELK